MEEPRKRYAAMMSGLDIHYDLGEGHPLLGRRMPDLDLVTASGPQRVFALLHDARPLFLDLGEPAPSTSPRGRSGSGESTRATRRVGAAGVRRGRCTRRRSLVRPDGYVAWVGRRYRRGPARRHSPVVRPAHAGVAVARLWCFTIARTPPAPFTARPTPLSLLLTSAGAGSPSRRFGKPLPLAHGSRTPPSPGACCGVARCVLGAAAWPELLLPRPTPCRRS